MKADELWMYMICEKIYIHEPYLLCILLKVNGNTDDFLLIR